MQDVNPPIKSSNRNNIQEVVSVPVINNEYLNLFCKAISDETLVDQTPFKQVYQSKITYFTTSLQSEVMKNLSHLNNDKKDNYLFFVIDKITRTPYYRIQKSKMIEFLSDYDMTITDFPNFSNPDMDSFFKANYFTEGLTIRECDDIYVGHQQFYRFAAKIEADIMIDFLESKLFSASNTATDSETLDQSDNSNQLSVNQSVILLDKLGIFNSILFENKPNTKKAKLISLLLGKNEKNVKTAIEKLELKSKDVTIGYQRDLDKIQVLLDKLE